MIRRNFMFDDGTAGWLLISQIEHARISGALTRAWSEPFSQEVIDGIAHHDDGWARWEAAPEIDAMHGRPLSFLELDVADAIKIWSQSIDSARKFGPLAGAIVAGHFVGLARGSEHASQPPAREWLTETTATRQLWLNEWRKLADSNTSSVAEHAQQMMYAADLLSLWLCMNGPVTAADESAIPNSEMQTRSTTVLGKYNFAVQATSNSADRLDWAGSVTPWPFAASELEFVASASAVPIRDYSQWPAIAAAARPFELRWRLSTELARRERM
jgi:hypothetical protein